jgi:hypothetical protein
VIVFVNDGGLAELAKKFEPLSGRPMAHLFLPGAQSCVMRPGNDHG